MLTVEESNAGSHSGKRWKMLIDSFRFKLDSDNRAKVFVLLGSDAKSKSVLVSNPRHLVHQSPLAAYRGFVVNNLCSLFLKSNSLTKIAW